MIRLFIECLVLGVGVICAIVEWVRRSWAKRLQHLPTGPPPKPVIGNVLDFGYSLHEIYRRSYGIIQTYGKTFTVYIGPVPFIMITDDKIVGGILSSPKYINKGQAYDLLKPWLGEGLLISTGQKWHKRRKTLTPAFHFTILQQFVEVFNSESTSFVEHLKKNVNSGPFDIYPYSTLCSLDIICKTAMGISVNAQSDANSPYVKAVMDICQIVMDRALSVWKRFDFLFNLSSDGYVHAKSLKILHDTTNSVIKARREMWENKEINYNDIPEDTGVKKKMVFLDVLLASTIDDKPLSNEDIREEVDTFMFEGHDTVSSAISFALYLLANNPDCQKKLFAELLEMFGSDLSRDPTYSELQEMTYMDLVIKETLRLFPSVPLILRSFAEPTEIEGCLIPAGVDVVLPLYLIQHNSAYFPDPFKFKPERFLDEDNAQNPYIYVPFSAGPRNCIGQKFAYLEMRATISKVIRHYELISAGPKYEVQILPSVILKSDNGVHLQLRKRQYPN